MKVTVNQFFTELASYLNMSAILSQGSQAYINGIGMSALEDFPEILSSFQNIRGVLRITWEGRAFPTLSGRTTNAVPYLYRDGMHTLYLPVNQISMPYTPLAGDIKTFRAGPEGEPTNLVIYRNSPPVVVTMALIMRNSVMAPWVGYFSRILEDAKGSRVRLIVPKYSLSEGNSARDYSISGRVVRFTVSDIIGGSQPATLLFLPDTQGLALLDEAGI